MKAKTNFSTLAAETVARGGLAMFAGIVIFIAGFVTWSAAGAISAIIKIFA